MIIDLQREDFLNAVAAFKEFGFCRSDLCPIAQAISRKGYDNTYIEVCSSDCIFVDGDIYRDTRDDAVTQFINWFDQYWDQQSIDQLICTAPHLSFEIEEYDNGDD